jgi:hypothetical protein
MVMWLRILVRWLARGAAKRMKINWRRDEDRAGTDQAQALAESDTELRQHLDQVPTSEAELRRLLDQTSSALAESEASLHAVHQTRAWRLMTRWWRLKRRLVGHW